MKSEEKLISDAYKNAQMGVEGIDSIMGISNSNEFRSTLKRQREEYSRVMESAQQMLRQRTGRQPENIGAMKKAMTRMTAAMETITDKSPSKLAEMMIQGSTMGITEMQKDLNDYSGGDERVTDLGQKLIRTEQANISEMKKYL